MASSDDVRHVIGLGKLANLNFPLWEARYDHEFAAGVLDAQIVEWKLFCLVHTIEKLAHHGYAA